MEVFVAIVVFFRYGKPYAQYEVFTNLGHLNRNHNCEPEGFSTYHWAGRNQSMISCVRNTSVSAFSRSRGVEALLRAMLYCSHGQLAQTQVKCPLGRVLNFQSRIF